MTLRTKEHWTRTIEQQNVEQEFSIATFSCSFILCARSTLGIRFCRRNTHVVVFNKLCAHFLWYSLKWLHCNSIYFTAVVAILLNEATAAFIFTRIMSLCFPLSIFIFRWQKPRRDQLMFLLLSSYDALQRLFQFIFLAC